jgi:hypothetical protein
MEAEKRIALKVKLSKKEVDNLKTNNIEDISSTQLIIIRQLLLKYTFYEN